MADSFAPFGPQLKCLVLREAHVVATGNPSGPIAPFCFLHSTLTWRKPHFPLPVPLLSFPSRWWRKMALVLCCAFHPGPSRCLVFANGCIGHFVHAVSPQGCSRAEPSDGSGSFLQVQLVMPGLPLLADTSVRPLHLGGVGRELLSLLVFHLLGLLGGSLKDSPLSLTVHRSCVSLTYFPVPSTLLLSCQPMSPGSRQCSWVEFGLQNEMDSQRQRRYVR